MSQKGEKRVHGMSPAAGTLHLKTENANPFCHVADASVKSHGTYKYKDIAITKTIMMRRDITVNSALTLVNDC